MYTDWPRAPALSRIESARAGESGAIANRNARNRGAKRMLILISLLLT
jgi:hypothetical protein